MLHLPLKTSLIWHLSQAVFHGTALFALQLNSVPLLWNLAIGVAVLAHWCSVLGQLLPANKRRLHRLRLSPRESRLLYCDHETVMSPPRVKFISSYLIILGFQAMADGLPVSGLLPRAKNLTVPILPDSLCPEENRALRRFIRFEL